MREGAAPFAGARLGPYQIEARIGAGGMGEVYRARDTRLDRTVAVKVLPPQFSADPDRRERFEREARAVAALSHPHICTLHDVGEQDGVVFLVMEHLDGATLAERLERGRLPVVEALRRGIELADALDKVHRQGVIHRDLKPGNVMLTPSGAKLLDFGLARVASHQAGVGSELSTPSHPLTEQGTVLGTFHYMAPEQIEGKEADARADVFALGAVLYEMLTGRRAFSGATRASVIGAALYADPPPMAEITPSVPRALERAVRKCLAKDREARWQTARDLRDELQWILDEGLGPALAPGTAEGKRPGRLLAAAAVGILVGGAIAWVALAPRHEPSATRNVRAVLVAPHLTRFPAQAAEEGGFALSPDGRQLTFVARDPEGKDRLWVRPLDAAAAQPLAGTEGAHNPFWSPDSRSIAFFANGQLRRIAAAGGAAHVLCPAPAGRGGTWSREDVILFAPDYTNSPIHRVSASGGPSRAVTRLDPALPSQTHRWPFFLPDGRRYLYLDIASLTGPVSGGGSSIRGGSLDGKESRSLTPADSGAVLSVDHLLFLRGVTLIAQPFDARAMATTGEPFPVAESVHIYANRGLFSASPDGVLVYLGANPRRDRLAWIGREGKRLGAVGEPGEYANPRLSADGQRLAVRARDASGNFDVWLLDLVRHTPIRFTFDPAFEGSAIWSPDASRIAFDSSRKGGVLDLYVRPASGATPEVPLLAPGAGEGRTATDWSRDGRRIAFTVRTPRTRMDLWIADLSAGVQATPFLETPAAETHGQFSPDGRWLAYVSDFTGSAEVYVASTADPGGRWQVSTTGGMHPRWRGDGRELFFLGPGGKLLAAPVRSVGAGLEVERARPLFDVAARYDLNNSPYDVAPDGQRFVVVDPAEGPGATQLSLVLNWKAGLERPAGVR